MTYAQFVKAHYHDAAHKGMKPQEVMKAVAKLYHAQKAARGDKKPAGGAKRTKKGGAVSAGAMRKQVKGGGDIGQLLGNTLGSLLPF